MIVGDNEESLKPNRSELTFLAWAFAISLIVHLFAYGTYSVGNQLGWWKYLAWPAWMRHAQPKTPDKKDDPQLVIQEQEQDPGLFIETTPIQTVAEAPKNAKYYSDKNTAAANPDADKDTDVPKIDGTQIHEAKTEDTPRHDMPLKPSLPAPEIRATPKENISGDLAFAKLKTTDDDKGDAPHTRPRTLLQAQAQDPSLRTGQKMKQDGGVKRRMDFTSMDTKATPFGAYDSAFYDAVKQRWLDLIDQHNFVEGRRGHVAVEFVMNYDGRITDVNIVDTDLGEMLGLLCEKAILVPAPFAAWPSDMRRMLGDTRHVILTFYYE